MSNLEAIHLAADRLKDVVRETPLLSSPFLDEIAGRRIWVKGECLQHTGSFKFRGGYSAVSSLSAAQRERGVIAYSSGNHAQGVALAARMLDAPAVIIMPGDAPRQKIENTRAFGAEVVLYDRPGGEDREAIGRRIAQERGLTLIRPFNEPMVIAGQGTTGLEISRQAKKAGIERADVLVPCGGGGLSSGIALSLEAHAPGMRVRTCEPQGFDDVARSLQAGQRTAGNSGVSICDAILTPMPGEITFPILSRLCGPGLSASDDDVLKAMVHAFLRLKICVEPGGAVALAAALFQREAFETDDLVVVATGGNVDAEVFEQALRVKL